MKRIRNAIGFAIFVVGAVLMCLGILVAFGVDTLNNLPEILRPKFWQGKN